MVNTDAGTYAGDRSFALLSFIVTFISAFLRLFNSAKTC